MRFNPKSSKAFVVAVAVAHKQIQRTKNNLPMNGIAFEASQTWHFFLVSGLTRGFFQRSLK
jgi:hypothetical protein